MPAVQTNGITVEYETVGSPDGEPMLMVMGNNAQLVVWPQRLLDDLAAAGFYVIVYDNRDVGLSTWFPVGTDYTIGDMAADGMGLLDALGVASAHVVGASMGGGIVQCMAIEYPDRVRSLCSIMSSTSAPDVPGPSPDFVAKAMELMGRGVTERDAIIEQAPERARLTGSTGFEIDDDKVRALAARVYDRAHNPDGGVNHTMAVRAAGDRTEALGKVTVPTVVIHGSTDPLVPVMGGEFTAKAIPGAELVIIDGMGHDLPDGALPIVTNAIIANARKHHRRVRDDAPGTNPVR